jgi:hypothetical protein
VRSAFSYFNRIKLVVSLTTPYRIIIFSSNIARLFSMTDSEKQDEYTQVIESLTKLQNRFSGIDKLAERVKSLSAPNIVNLARMPHLEPIRLPTLSQQNEYQSATILVKRLANTIAQWREQVPSDSQPAILAILHGGIQINVSLLAVESFHGIRIEGTIGGDPCMLLAHQSSVQLLCYIAKVEKEEFRRKIGFIIDGEESHI